MRLSGGGQRVFAMNIELFEGLSAIEWVIFGFIAVNVTIVGICLALSALKRALPSETGLMAQTKRDASTP